MKTALVGFGGCGENMVDFLSRENRKFLLTALVMEDSRGRKNLGEDTGIALYSPRDLGSLEQKLDSVEVCFMIGGLAGDSCKNMLELARKLRQRRIMTFGLTAFPFRFENLAEKAQTYLYELEKALDAIVVFDNDKLAKDLGRGNSLSAGLEAMANAMSYCLKSLTGSEYDVVDLRATLHGRVYYSIGHSGEKHLPALRNAMNTLKKEFPPDFRMTSGLLGVYCKEMEDWWGDGGEIRELMDAKKVSWLVTFGFPIREDCSSVTILACGQRNLQDLSVDQA